MTGTSCAEIRHYIHRSSQPGDLIAGAGNVVPSNPRAKQCSTQTIQIESFIALALETFNAHSTYSLQFATNKTAASCKRQPIQISLQLPAAKRLLQMRQDLLYYAVPLQEHRMICQHQLSCFLSSLRHQLLMMLLLGVQQQHCHLSDDTGVCVKSRLHCLD